VGKAGARREYRWERWEKIKARSTHKAMKKRKNNREEEGKKGMRETIRTHGLCIHHIPYLHYLSLEKGKGGNNQENRDRNDD